GSDNCSFQFPCAIGDCETRSLVAITCPSCSLNFCLSHRHPPDHACTSLLPQSPTKEQLAHEKVDAIAASLAHRPARKAGHRDPKLAAKVQLMKMKMKAVKLGQSSLLQQEAVYLQVLLPSGHTQPSVAVCVPSAWSLGRTLDAVADLAKVQNNNDKQPVEGGAVLQLFRRDSGCVLPAAASLQDLLTKEDLFNGDILVLERTPKGVTILPHMDAYPSS
ncbi:AN1-type zinc finger protein 1, partial [Hyalella azteca]|uniref:AN1-type zinc finger protein 1 n=1 Tax=Hyalella azteca TaxID=294128 RepID=A0A8B7PDT4_HYAAZ